MKSIRLARYSREEILDSVLREFEKTYWKELGFEHRAEHRAATADVLDSAMAAIWQKCYGHLDLSGVPTYLLSGSPFSVANESSETRMRALKNMPGTSSSGVDILLSVAEWDSFFAEYDRLEAMVKPWETEYSTFKKEVWATLESVNTTGQLVELWPSAENYIPAHLADPEKGINLPALHISRLDAKLGGAK